MVLPLVLIFGAVVASMTRGWATPTESAAVGAAATIAIAALQRSLTVAALRKALSDPVLLEKLTQLGTLPFPEAELTPEAHAKLFASDLPRVAKLVESSGIKASEAK